MPPGEVAPVIISLFLFAVPVWIVAIRTRHTERMAEISRAQASSEASSSEIAALREEVAKLRDTTTQYDLSVEHALQELNQRLAVVERGMRVKNPAQTEEAPPLRLGRDSG
jgi:hypothetical protein